MMQSDDSSLLSFIHVMLVEHIIQCRLVQGKLPIGHKI